MNAVADEELDPSVVHDDGNRHLDFLDGLPEHLAEPGIELQETGRLVEA